MFIVYCIIALIAGYFLIKKFTQIDHAFFADVIGRSEFGLINLIIAAISGAIAGSSWILTEVFEWDGDAKPFLIISIIVFGASMAHIVYTSIIQIKGVSGIISKILYLTILSIFMCGVGIISSFIALLLATVLLVLMYLGGMGNGKKTLRTEGGIELKESGGGLFGEKYYKDKNGTEYESHDGGNNVTRR
ncbi:MAG: hypothetical protein R3Y16_02255 [Rikenellaceae bacterium]